MIPLKTLIPRDRFPFITLCMIAVNFIVFAHQQLLGPHAAAQFIMTYGLVPARVPLFLGGAHVTFGEAFLPLFTCMFLHGGWLHIIGNMWFLWLFGSHVEDRLGHFSYLMFYLICGIGSGATQMIFEWGSQIPSIGASGAIAGALGAYVIFFPRSRILTLIPLFIIWFTVKLPALLFIGLWFIVQFLSGLSSLGATATGGVAWWAHVGGFLLGVILVHRMRRSRQAPYYGD